MARPDASRRSFIQTAGAALSVPLAAAATSLRVDAAEHPDPLQSRLARLEDLDAIRALNQAYARHVSAGDGEGLAALFADPSTAAVAADLRGLTPEGFGEQDVIDIAPDRQTATAVLHCTLDLETAIAPDCPLVEMARQQGGGVVRRTEPGVLEHAYVRRDGAWKIAHAVYRPRQNRTPAPTVKRKSWLKNASPRARIRRSKTGPG